MRSAQGKGGDGRLRAVPGEAGGGQINPRAAGSGIPAGAGIPERLTFRRPSDR